jgi:hypothetical protein
LLVVAESAAEPLRHASSLTLRLKRESWLLRHGEVEGMRVRAVVEKSKLSGSRTASEFDVRFARGTFMAPWRQLAARPVEDLERPLVTLAS